MKKNIEIKNLSYSFTEKSTPLFDNQNYSINQNQLTIIKGKNGVGKSTLLQIIAADPLVKKNVSGTLTIDGVTYALQSNEYSKFAREKITLVGQKFDEQLVPEATFQQNLAYASFGKYPSAFSFIKLPAVPLLADTFSLPINIPVHKLSGGQRQVLALLMGINRSTKLLLLDEPTATLDEQNADLVMRCIAKLIKETEITILMICHDSSLYHYTTEEILSISKKK